MPSSSPVKEPLGERQAQILRAIVREYIRTGEPVGSKYLVEHARITASPATVRSEMARLEELGYLGHPHTSAGRVPTDLGYRFVVDHLRPRPLGEGQRRALATGLGEGEPASVDDLLHKATDAVARLTHHAAAVLARRESPSRLRRIELFPMGARMATLVLIAENGRVEQRMIPLDEDLTEDDVDGLGRRVAGELKGTTLEAAVAAVRRRAQGRPAAEAALLECVAAACQTLRDSEEQVVVGGVSNLASEQSFERETLQRLYEALERQTAVLDLLASAVGNPFSVRIGSEHASEDFRSCSIVVANFGPDGARGSVGVIGPTRMDYDRVIAAATAMGHLLEGTLGPAELT